MFSENNKKFVLTNFTPPLKIIYFFNKFWVVG